MRQLNQIAVGAFAAVASLACRCRRFPPAIRRLCRHRRRREEGRQGRRLLDHRRQAGHSADQGLRGAFPGVKVEYTDLNSTEVYNRFISEKRGQRGSADVVWSSSMDLQMKLAGDGWRARLQVARDRRRCRRGRSGRTRSSATTFEPIAIVYNKRLAAAPTTCRKTHADLIKLLNDQGRQVPEQGHHLRHREVGRRLHARSIRTRSSIRSSGTWSRRWARAARACSRATGTMMERVRSGENLIGYNILGSYALTRAKKDPSIGIVAHHRLQPGAVAADVRRQEREEPERRPSCGSTTCCPSAARRSSPNRPSSTRCAPT